VSTPLTGNVSIGAGLTTSGKGKGHKTDTNND